jgi:hypothetical protein
MEHRITHHHTRLFLLSIVLLFINSGAFSDVPPEQAEEVEHLINYLVDSDCRMVRNGKFHSSKNGAKHLQRKYKYFRDEISSPEEFIEYSATKSTMSGQFYEVLCADQEPELSRDWLLRELQAYRSRQTPTVP